MKEFIQIWLSDTLAGILHCGSQKMSKITTYLCRRYCRADQVHHDDQHGHCTSQLPFQHHQSSPYDRRLPCLLRQWGLETSRLCVLQQTQTEKGNHPKPTKKHNSFIKNSNTFFVGLFEKARISMSASAVCTAAWVPSALVAPIAERTSMAGPRRRDGVS